MGISKGGFGLLAQLSTTKPMSGSVLTLGRQHVFLNSEEANDILTNAGLAEFNFVNGVNDEQLLRALGFSEVQSLDFNDFEGSTICHDLNLPVPKKLHGRFDWVLDFGTIEHIFDVREVLGNICDLLSKSGVVVHLSPTNNHVDHGFYQFSPTFFQDYYVANGWEIIDCAVIDYSRKHSTEPWKVLEYEIKKMERLSFGGWGSQLLATYFVAQKIDSARRGIVPQQGYYKNKLWLSPIGSEQELVLGVRITLHSRIKSLPILGSLILKAYSKLSILKRRKNDKLRLRVKL
jgi:SAM-dependent methyltransferase